MTALEETIKTLDALKREALYGDAVAREKFLNMVFGSWPTIKHALDELAARRVIG